MKKLLSLVLVVMLSMFLFTGCGGGNVEKMTVNSSSINSAGRLYTVTAANFSNKSPALVWNKVDDAVCYAVVMFDITANWLHMLVFDITATEITEGQFNDTSLYIGPYPPANSGDHIYRIEVFALKEKPQNISISIDKKLNYNDIVKALNGNNENILARGYVDGKYANGDNTIR